MTETAEKVDLSKATPRLVFGDLVENIAASECNPIKRGRFVRMVRRTGKLNAGKYVEYIDNVKGNTHLTPPDNIRRIGDAFTERDELIQALRSVDAEFGDYHYGTCPADMDRLAECNCFAGKLMADVHSLLERVSK